jgi:hypothetical protein
MDIPGFGSSRSSTFLVLGTLPRPTRWFLAKQEEETTMKKTFVIALAAGALFGLDTVAMAQTPAVGDTPAATVGQDAATARHREVNRERGMTTGSTTSMGTAGQINRGMRSDRMLPERLAPDAEEATPAGH